MLEAAARADRVVDLREPAVAAARLRARAAAGRRGRLGRVTGRAPDACAVRAGGPADRAASRSGPRSSSRCGSACDAGAGRRVALALTDVPLCRAGARRCSAGARARRCRCCCGWACRLGARHAAPRGRPGRHGRAAWAGFLVVGLFAAAVVVGSWRPRRSRPLPSRAETPRWGAARRLSRPDGAARRASSSGSAAPVRAAAERRRRGRPPARADPGAGAARPGRPASRTGAAGCSPSSTCGRCSAAGPACRRPARPARRARARRGRGRACSPTPSRAPRASAGAVEPPPATCPRRPPACSPAGDRRRPGRCALLDVGAVLAPVATPCPGRAAPAEPAPARGYSRARRADDCQY